MSDKYFRKEPIRKHVDMLLSCGHTVTGTYNPDLEDDFELGDTRYCKKCKAIEIVQSLTPWDEIIIE